MKFSIKRSIVLGTILLFLSLFSPAVVAQTNINGTLTVDNSFTIYVSTNFSVAGTPIAVVPAGSEADWTQISTLVATALTPGVLNWLQVEASNTTGPGMFLGSFSLSNTGFIFNNQTQNLLTNTNYWSVSNTGWNGTYQSAVVVDTVQAWTDEGYPGSIDAGASYIWSSNPAGENTTVYFVAAILPNEIDLDVSTSKDPDEVIAGGPAPGTGRAGHTITVTNPATIEATTVSVALLLDSDTGVSLATYNQSLGTSFNGTDTWTIGTMPPDSSVVLNLFYDVGPTAPAATTGSDRVITKDITATADQYDPNPDNNTDKAVRTDVARVSDLAIVKVPEPEFVTPGDLLTYHLTVTNAGPSNADNVVVVDTLPPEVTVDSMPNYCIEAPAGTVTCTLPGEIAPAPDPGVTFDIVIRIAEDSGYGSLVNMAELDLTGSSSTDPNPDNNRTGAVLATIVPAVPAEGTALIAVQKYFSDGNNETEVTLQMTCVSGDYNSVPETVLPDNGDAFEQIFVISNIPLVNGEGTTCTVTEEPVNGYDTEYRCPPVESMSETDENCEPKGNGNVRKDNFACKYSNIQEGDSNYCEITNLPAPVEVEVTKVWEVVNMGGDDFTLALEINIGCDAEIIDGYQKGNKWYYDEYLYDFDFEDEDGEFTGMATVTVEVIPEWFKTANDPDNQKYTECWAGETGVSSAVETESDCGDKAEPGMQVAPGTGDSCTITNTLFFEGIPTLNQYGLAIMALLMLGMGLVGFRRFV